MANKRTNKPSDAASLDPRLRPTLLGLLAHLPQNRDLPMTQLSLHVAVKDLQVTCPALAGMTKCRGSGFSQDVEALLSTPDLRKSVVFTSTAIRVSDPALRANFDRESAGLLDGKTVAAIQRASALLMQRA